MFSKTTLALAFLLATAGVASAQPQNGTPPPPATKPHPKKHPGQKPAANKPKPATPPAQKPPPPKPAQPATPPAGQTPPPKPAEPAKVREGNPADQKIDAALDDLTAKIQQKKLEAGDYERVRAALRERADASAPADPDAQARMARIQQSIDALDQRARDQKLTPAHVDMVREQVVDERLDQAVDRWRNAVAAGKVGDDEYRAVAQQLNRRAEVAQSFDPEALTFRQHMQTRLEALQARAKDTPLRTDDVIDFRKELLDQRLEHAFANLERRATDKDLTHADLARARGLLEDHADVARDDAQLASLHQRLGNALGALDQKVATGQVDPAEVGKLRALLLHKAREAGAATEPREKPANPDKPANPPK